MEKLWEVIKDFLEKPYEGLDEFASCTYNLTNKFEINGEELYKNNHNEILHRVSVIMKRIE